MPAALIGAGLSLGGFGMSIMGASRADASNKKAIQQQYKQDKANWKFENNQRADVYGYEQQSVAINRQNNENEIKFRETNDRQAYDRQMAERKREYKLDKDAYKESEEDYKTQTGLNKKIASLALSESQNKRKEQRLEQGFANQRNQLSYLQAQDSVNMALKGNKNDLKDALGNKKVSNKRNVNALQQSQTAANLSIEQGRANKGLAKNETRLGKEALKDKRRSALTSKFGNKQALKDQIENANLTRDQNIDSITDTFGDQKLANKQQRDAINRDRDRELMSSNQNIANIRDTYGDQALAVEQNKANLEDTLGDQKLAKDQAIADLDDNEKYQLFEGDNRIADLEGELVTSALEYQQKRATQAFQQEANNIEALQAQGAASASGQRGRSAARQVASSMAAAGRANAQLTDNILRGAAQQEDKVSNINRRIKEAGSLQTMQKLTTERRKGDQEDTYQRSVADRDRLVGNQTDNLARSLADRNRLTNQQKSIKTFAKTAAQEQNKDINATQRRQQMDKNRQVGDQRESRNLVKNQTQDKMKLENRVFQDSVKSMKTEKKQLLASLDASLSQYGFDIKRSKNSKLAAKQDFKANQQGAKEAYRSAARDYNLTNKQQTKSLKRADQQRTIEKQEFKQSIKSINKAFKANVKGIALDQYSANITADKNRMTKPIPGPKPPKPIKYPKTIYQDPREPMTTPKPVKGVAKGGAMLSAVGSGLTSLSGINFAGVGEALSGK